MYKPWQDSTSLPMELNSPLYENGGASMPAISASAVRDAKGRVHMAFSNQNPNTSQTVVVKLSGVEGDIVSARTLTGPGLDSRNTFDQPDAIRPAAFRDYRKQPGGWSITLPPKSVTVLDM